MVVAILIMGSLFGFWGFLWMVLLNLELFGEALRMTISLWPYVVGASMGTVLWFHRKRIAAASWFDLFLIWVCSYVCASLLCPDNSLVDNMSSGVIFAAVALCCDALMGGFKWWPKIYFSKYLEGKNHEQNLSKV